MARVECSVQYDDVENEHGCEVPGVIVTCSECDHQVACFGQTSRSVRRGLVMLREECPMGEENYYTAEEADD